MDNPVLRKRDINGVPHVLIATDVAHYIHTARERNAPLCHTCPFNSIPSTCDGMKGTEYECLNDSYGGVWMPTMFYLTERLRR